MYWMFHVGVYIMIGIQCTRGHIADCDFESGLCGWTQDTEDDGDWFRHDGSTRTFGTGPDGDHTTGTGYYMYLEASDFLQTGSKAMLSSPAVSSALKGSAQLVFWYHMYGNGIGTLNVYVALNSGAKINVWELSGNQDNTWKKAEIPLPVVTDFKITFEAIRGSNFLGDIAIDDIQIVSNLGTSTNPLTTKMDIQTSTEKIPQFTSIHSSISTEGTYATQANTEGMQSSHYWTFTSIQSSISTESTYATQTKTEGTSTNPLTTKMDIQTSTEKIPQFTSIQSSISTEGTYATQANTEEVKVEANLSISTVMIEGEYGELSCFITAGKHYQNPDDIKVTWTQNGYRVKPSSRVSLSKTCKSSSAGFHCNGSLTFSRIYITDEGDMSCKVQGDSEMSAESAVNVKVYHKAKVQLTPSTPFVSSDDTVTLTCTIINSEETYLRNTPDFMWCFHNMSTIPGNSNAYVLSDELQTRTISRLKILYPRNEDIYCGINNCTEMSTMSVIMKDDQVCASTIQDNIQWNETKAGATQKQPCPTGYSGKVTRLCGRDGIWRKTNFSLCIKTKLAQISEIVVQSTAETAIEPQIMETTFNAIQDIINTTESSSSSSTNENNKANERLQAKDIGKSVELVRKISKANFSFDSVSEAEKTTKALASVVTTIIEKSKLLKRENDEIEKEDDKTSEAKETGEKIVDSVESFGKSVEKSLKANQSVTVKKDTLDLLIKKTPPVGIKFPEDDENDVVGISRLSMPGKTLEKLGIKDEVSFTAVRYKGLGALLTSAQEHADNDTTNSTKGQVNSDVLSLSLNVAADFIDPPITLEFIHLQEDFQSPICVFFNKTDSRWSADGCKMINSSHRSTICQCNHLTNFAILMSPMIADPLSYHMVTPSEQEGLKIMSVIGCSISVACCLLTVLVYIKFWRKIRSRRSALIISLCLALIIGYLLFMLGVERTENQTGCVIIAAALHYIFLSVFSIMLAIAIDIVLAIVQVFVSTSKWWPLILFAWVSPVIIVGISLAVTQLNGYGDTHFCWLRGTTLYAFVVPALVIIVANLCILIYALKVMYSTHLMMSKSTKEKTKSGIRSVCSLLPLLGLTWLFGVLAISKEVVVFQYLFTIFNSIQGVLVFVFHCFMNKQIQMVVTQRFRRLRVFYSSLGTSKEEKSKSSGESDTHASTGQSETRRKRVRGKASLCKKLRKGRGKTSTSTALEEISTSGPRLLTVNNVLSTEKESTLSTSEPGQADAKVSLLEDHARPNVSFIHGGINSSLTGCKKEAAETNDSMSIEQQSATASSSPNKGNDKDIDKGATDQDETPKEQQHLSVNVELPKSWLYRNEPDPRS